MLSPNTENFGTDHASATNRENAQKSTGPRTETGKAASSKNRLTHGLCSTALILDGEHEQDFDSLHAEIMQSFAPATDEEHLLASQLIEALWRLNRARRVETKAFDVMIIDTAAEYTEPGTEESAPNPDFHMACSFWKESNVKALTCLQRYVTAAERNYRQALKTLQQTQQVRASRPVPPPVEEKAPVKEKAMAASAGSVLPEIGFESKFVPSDPFTTPAHNSRC